MLKFNKDKLIVFLNDQAPLYIAFLVPIKLIFTYFVLFPAICWQLYRIYLGDFRPSRSVLKLCVPLIFFVLIGVVSSSFGLNPLRSLYKLPRLAFYLCTVFVICEYSLRHGILKPALAMLAGQTLASSYSVLEVGTTFALPQLFLGTITESGQLALTTILACGLIVFLAGQLSFPAEVPLARRRWQKLLYFSGTCGLIAFIFAVIFAFGETFAFSRMVINISGILFYAMVIYAFLYIRKIWRQAPWDQATIFLILVSTVLPILLTALLVNMKRGPWSGVFIALLLFLLLYARKTVLPVIIVVVLTIISLQPLRERLLASSEHFFIHGGRNEIWSIGSELATRYPLGIGHANSRVLLKYSESIPAELNHFHNNLIQIVVETGWLGFFIFCWWIWAILKMAFPRGETAEQTLLARTFGCSILAWQLAGIVEYNFGDSQVLFAVFVILGLLAANDEKQCFRAQ